MRAIGLPVRTYAGGMPRFWKARIPRPIWFSDAHEAEAKKEQRRKPPSRFGKWLLRRLGYTGGIATPPRAPSQHSDEHLKHKPRAD